MKDSDLLTGNPRKLFMKYLVPCISSTLVTSIYILADTIMIGQGIGASALASLNLLIPIIATLFATGLLFGVGGGVLMSIAHGGNDSEKAKQYFSTALVGNTIAAVVFLLVGTMFFEQIAYGLGATSSNFQLVSDYGKYIIGFSPFFMFSTFLQAFVRNDQAPKRAMIAVLVGAGTNIVLDYVFIFILNMGMQGGAIATVIGNSMTVIILITHFLSKKNTMHFKSKMVSFSVLKEIMQCGIASFLIEAASGIVIFIFNLQILRYIGEVGIVVYGIISNVAIIGMSLFNGVAQAAQPIIATNFGAGKYKRVSEVKKIGVIVASGLGGVLFMVGYIFPEPIIGTFVAPTPKITGLGIHAIRVYFIMFLMMGINIFYTNYFQAIMNHKEALIVSLLRGVLLSSGLVFILPYMFGANTIWAVIPITEAITLLIAVILGKRLGSKLMEE